MKAHAETIRQMSQTLESSGFSRDQSEAVIESVATAMRSFAVTPELLDDRFTRHKNEISAQLKEYRDDTNKRLDEIPKLRDATYALRDEVHALQRSQLRYFLAFTLIILAGLMGTVGAVLAN